MKAVLKDLFVILTVSFVFAGCKEPQTPQELVNDISTLKSNAEAQADATPYREQQYVALNSYFSELGLFAVSLKDDPERAKRFNESLSKFDLGTLCQQILMPQDRWNTIVKNCTRNRYFLCADEVAAYQTFVKAIRDTMNGNQRARFEAAYPCKIAIGE